MSGEPPLGRQYVRARRHKDDKTSALSKVTKYKDRTFGGDDDEYLQVISNSTTLYIGNLAFATTEEQIYEVFALAGDLKRVIMGLDKVNKTPCGFCFAEFNDRESADNAVRFLNGTTLDNRIIRIDWDRGFEEGRQFGRGKFGGQVRDEYRLYFDPGRGGFGKLSQGGATSNPTSKIMGFNQKDTQENRPEKRVAEEMSDGLDDPWE